MFKVCVCVCVSSLLERLLQEHDGKTARDCPPQSYLASSVSTHPSHPRADLPSALTAGIECNSIKQHCSSVCYYSACLLLGAC